MSEAMQAVPRVPYTIALEYFSGFVSNLFPAHGNDCGSVSRGACLPSSECVSPAIFGRGWWENFTGLPNAAQNSVRVAPAVEGVFHRKKSPAKWRGSR